MVGSDLLVGNAQVIRPTRVSGSHGPSHSCLVHLHMASAQAPDGQIVERAGVVTGA